MCYYRDGQTRRAARLCRDQDTKDGSTGVGGGALADLATLPSCWLAGCFFVVVVVAGQQHPRQFPERRRLQARHFRFDLWKNTEDLEARNEKKNASAQLFKNLSVGFGRDSWHPEFSVFTSVNRCVSFTDFWEVRVSVKWVNLPHVLNLNFSFKWNTKARPKWILLMSLSGF